MNKQHAENLAKNRDFILESVKDENWDLADFVSLDKSKR